MTKRELKSIPVLQPVPVALVTCVDQEGRSNIITIAWAGIVCSVPPMLSIAVRPERFSHRLISEGKEFVVNVPSADHLWAVDYCGTRSGRHEDKFATANFTPLPAKRVRPPLLAECPINMECVVLHELKLGTHDLFVGEIVALHANVDVLDNSGRIAPGRVQPLAYVPGVSEYWGLSERLARFGHSVDTAEASS